MKLIFFLIDNYLFFNSSIKARNSAISCCNAITISSVANFNPSSCDVPFINTSPWNHALPFQSNVCALDLLDDYTPKSTVETLQQEIAELRAIIEELKNK